MATSGKKNKRVRGKTFCLNEFLAEDNSSPQAGYAVATTVKKDWASEMENEMLDDKYTLDGAFVPKDKFILPTMPRAAREPLVSSHAVPSKPPYTAFIANVPYEVDQEDILKFFKGLKVKSVRLPRDSGESGRLKGFGYAEFETKEDLIEALLKDDHMLKGRKVHVQIAQEDSERDRDRGRDDKADRTATDWRSGPRDLGPPSRDDRYRNGPDRYSERERDWYSQDRDRFPADKDRGGFERRGFERNNRSYSSDRERNPSSDRGFERDSKYGDRYNDRFRNRDDRDRYDGQDRGYERGNRGGGRRDFGSDFRGDRYSDRRDDFRSSRGGLDRYDRGASYERETEKEPPKERRKLQLLARSVIKDELSKPASSNSSIFGGAKPVDTAAREREIEERLEREKGGREEGERKVVRRDEKFSEKEEKRDGRDDYREPFERSRQSSGGGVRSPRNSTTSFHSGDSRLDSERSNPSQSEPEDEDRTSLSGKPPSPRKEDTKAVPAPPPKENAWQKRQGSSHNSDRRKNSVSSEGEKENRQYNTVPRTKRSSSISSNSSDKERSRRSSFDQRPPSGRRSEDGNYRRRENSRGQRYEDSISSDDSQSRRRNDRDRASDRGSRGGGRASNRSDRSWGKKDTLPQESNREHKEDHEKERERGNREPLKYEEPKPPVYASTNKFSHLVNDDSNEGSD